MRLIKKPIPKFDGLYEAHSNGKIFSLYYNRYLDGCLDGRGYPTCVLVNGSIKCTINVHRLIGLAFVPNPHKKPQINHKNGIKTDNRPVNLEWCTPTENIRHAFVNGLNKIGSGKKNHMWGRFGFKSNSGKPIIQFDAITNKIIKVWGSAAHAARITGLSRDNIRLCCQDPSRAWKKFKWLYASDYKNSNHPLNNKKE